MAGRFITLEGGEGSGKSTQARLLADFLRGRGVTVVLSREPGGTPEAEAVRALLVTGAADRWTPWAEACLVNAARTEHVARVIRPALAQGDWVICDRFVDSTRAYQGAGKGLADTDLLAMHALATGNLWPDQTLVLGLDANEGLARATARGGDEARFERHGAGFHARIAAFFQSLPAQEPERCQAISAEGSVATVAARIAHAVVAKIA